ncbi:hypothetical protein CEXT_781951 [Caerostris extrusa]|uniref:Uncharacterized protein n=1 Tax=Caerostris extrusa TaxID=172846 RepID=A0AAV4PZ49_CAEEX|nr:hypothetical protein CEXT_781951 [Caerostris extrusa]
MLCLNYACASSDPCRLGTTHPESSMAGTASMTRILFVSALRMQRGVTGPNRACHQTARPALINHRESDIRKLVFTEITLPQHGATHFLIHRFSLQTTGCKSFILVGFDRNICGRGLNLCFMHLFMTHSAVFKFIVSKYRCMVIEEIGSGLRDSVLKN